MEAMKTPARLPSNAKPSKGVSPDRTRPVVNHGYLRKTDDGIELLVTTTYTAARIPVQDPDGVLTEGFIPPEALKRIEREKNREFTAENGHIAVDGGKVLFERGEPGTYPDFSKWWPDDEPKKPLRIGLNAKLLFELAQAMGAESVEFTLDLSLAKNGTYLKPYRVRPLNGGVTDAEGLLMPVRVNT